MKEKEKERILAYLNAGEEIAVGAGCVMNHVNGEYTQIELIAYTDGVYDWTNEQIYNFEKNDEVFDEKLFDYILEKVQPGK